MLQSPEGDKLTYRVRLQYQATNNEVKYEALLKGLELAKSIDAESVLILGDSQLVMGQVNGTCEAKEERMKKYLQKVLQSVKEFKEATFVQENMDADALAKTASANQSMDEFDEIQYLPSIDIPDVLQVQNKES